MSAGVCGKRIGFEEIFGSSVTCSSAKRSRCSPIGSADSGFGSEDNVSNLLRMLPGIDGKLVENPHNPKTEDTIDGIHASSMYNASVEREAWSIDSMVIAAANDVQGFGSTQTPEPKLEDARIDNSNTEYSIPTCGSSWVDTFVQEMMKASDLDDARGRATGILESFERGVIAHTRELKEQEVASLKEHLQMLLRDNQILKRAVTIQYERYMEQEEKVREVQQLKHALSQYQEQVRTLELNNYTLKLHLQRAQDSSSIPGHFHPNVF